MLDKQAIQNEIKRKQEQLDIYMRAGKLEEAQRLSAEIEFLLSQL